MAEFQPPHSQEAEESLLGCLIIDPNLYHEITDGFRSEDFYYPKNGAVFKALEALHNEQSAVDNTTLTNMLENQGNLKSVGGMDYLYHLASQAPLTHNVKEYSKIIKDLSLTRTLISTAQGISDLAYTNHEDVNKLLAEAESRIFNLSNNQNTDNGLIPIQKIIFQTLEQIHEINANKGKLTGIPTGFVDLDQMTSGLQKSDLVIIAARPSMGKTAFALNIATHAALKENKNVMIFSLEMSRQQLAMRMILSEACIDGNDVRTGDLTAEQWRAITASADLISKSNIVINDTPGISIAELRSICRRRKIEKPIDLIVIDYMQLISGNSSRFENRQNEISDISRSLKQLAREMECPVICLSQLARGPESRQDKRPMLSDLRDSGSIEQDADVVMFLYRDAYYNTEDIVNPYEAELLISKQRNGPTGKVKLGWIAQYTKFTNFSEKGEEEEPPYEV